VATLVTEQGIVHYEAYGRGRPVLLLHGWLNSWSVWRQTVEFLGKEFRVYAIDFFGFGESDDEAGDFSVTNFSCLVEEFMNRLGIVKAPLVGHSMGGTVSLTTALRVPEKVVKVVVVGSPIEGSSLSPLLKTAALGAWQPVVDSAPFLFGPVQSGLKVFMRGYSRFLAKDSRALGNMLGSDIGKLSARSFLESIGTLRQTDLRPYISKLDMPVLGMYGKHDNIVHPNQGDVLKQYLPRSEIAWFHESGHFPMMDETERFHDTLRAFLNGTR
jgi:pimeloyl-ACP methyl ester carboxylesterase